MAQQRFSLEDGGRKSGTAGKRSGGSAADSKSKALKIGIAIGLLVIAAIVLIINPFRDRPSAAELAPPPPEGGAAPNTDTAAPEGFLQPGASPRGVAPGTDAGDEGQ